MSASIATALAQLKTVAVALPPEPPPAPLPTVLSVECEGCRMSLPMLKRESVDNAVWRCLTLFNYNPRAYKGWRTLPASKGCVAVRVS